MDIGKGSMPFTLPFIFPLDVVDWEDTVDPNERIDAVEELEGVRSSWHWGTACWGILILWLIL